MNFAYRLFVLMYKYVVAIFTGVNEGPVQNAGEKIGWGLQAQRAQVVAAAVRRVTRRERRRTRKMEKRRENERRKRKGRKQRYEFDSSSCGSGRRGVPKISALIKLDSGSIGLGPVPGWKCIDRDH